MRLRGIAGIEPIPKQIYHNRTKTYTSKPKEKPTKEEFRRVLMERMKEKNGK